MAHWWRVGGVQVACWWCIANGCACRWRAGSRSVVAVVVVVVVVMDVVLVLVVVVVVVVVAVVVVSS